MATTETREAKRTPVTLKIKFKSESLDQFIERYSVDISHGGIFIRTKDPLSVGTTLRFEFQLKDATPLITGEATVVWTREHDPSRAGVAPGMGVRFDRLPGDSQKVLDQILDHKSGSLDEDDEDDDDGGEFKDTPTRVAPAQLVDKLVNDFSETGDRTPLPRPMPFHSDADDFPDETFEEATRVASLDGLVASTKSEDDDDSDSSPSAGAARPEPDTLPPPSSASSAQSGAESGDDELRETAEESDDSDDGFELGDDGGIDDDDDSVVLGESESGEAERDDDGERAVVTPAVEPAEDAGGSMPWIAAAAAILLIGGVGGFWFLSQNRDASAQGEQAGNVDQPPPTQPSKAAVVPTEAAPEPVEPEISTVPVTIESVPEGATVKLVGSDQGGTTPATLQLEDGKSYEIEVTHPGYVARTVELRAGAEPAPIELEAMKKVVRISSSPPRATVLVNGRRQRGLTPLDIEIDARLARKDELTIAVRRAGYQTWYGKASTSSDFAELDGAMVQDLSATLERREARRPPKPEPESSDSNATKTGDSDGAAKPGDGAAKTGDGAAKPDDGTKKPSGEAATKPETWEEPTTKPETKREVDLTDEAKEPPAKPSGAPTPDWAE